MCWWPSPPASSPTSSSTADPGEGPGFSARQASIPLQGAASIAPEVEAAIKNNTALLDRLGATSVPFIVAKHQGSGQVVTQAGSMGTEALTRFLGIGQ